MNEKVIIFSGSRKKYLEKGDYKFLKTNTLFR